MGLDDGRETLLGHAEKDVAGLGGADGVDGDRDGAVGAVLETDRGRQTGRFEPNVSFASRKRSGGRTEFSVTLGLGRPRTDGAPRDRVGDELGRDGVQELDGARQAAVRLRLEVNEKA